MDRNTVFIVGGVLLITLLYLALGGGIDYPNVDVRDVDRAELFAAAEKLLAESEDWPAELSDRGVAVASSLDPYPVRTVRYSIEVEADMDRAIELIRDENYSGKGRRDKGEKYELTMYEDGRDHPVEWVRRSVHLAPPPGGNRDAVVLYYEDRPDPETYRIAFQSVETLDGKPWPEVEDAVRFHVFPSIYKVQETAPGKILIRKIEAVDPRGAMSPLMNNHIISKIFFRNYMFEQAKAMRDSLLEHAQPLASS